MNWSIVHPQIIYMDYKKEYALLISNSCRIRRRCFALPNHRVVQPVRHAFCFCTEHPPLMDLTQFLHAILNGDVTRIIILLIGSLVFLYALRYLLVSDPERAVDYEISIPEQCKPGWTGEALEEPSIKVCGSNNRSFRISYSYSGAMSIIWLPQIWTKAYLTILDSWFHGRTVLLSCDWPVSRTP